MPKDVKRSIIQLRVTLLVILVAASCLAAAVFFAEPAQGAEKSANPLTQEQTNEAYQGTEAAGGDTAAKSSSAAAGQDRQYSSGPKYCYITVAYGEDQPEIHPANTIKVGAEACNEIGLLLVRRYYESMVETQ